jgi:hypothetical protein
MLREKAVCAMSSRSERLTSQLSMEDRTSQSGDSRFESRSRDRHVVAVELRVPRSFQAISGVLYCVQAHHNGFARSNIGIVGSNPTQDMDVCVRLFCACVVPCICIGLATG